MPLSVKRVSRMPRTVPAVASRHGSGSGSALVAGPGRRRTTRPSFTAIGVQDRRTGPAEVFLVLPIAAAAGLAGDDQVEARHEGDQLAAGAGLGAGVGRDALAAPAALAGQARGQLPAVGEDLGVDLEAHLRAVDVVGRRGGLLDEPLRDHLPVVPAAVVDHAVGDPGQVARRHAQPVRRMAADLRPAVVVLEPPVLDPERLEQRLDGELVVGLAGDGLAHQRRVGQRVGRVAAGGAGIERQLLGPRVAAVAQDVLPGPVVGRAGRFGADARGVIEQLLDGDPGLAGIAQRLRPGDEVERLVVEASSCAACAPAGSAPRRWPGPWRRPPSSRRRRGGESVDGAVAPLLLQDDVAAADDDGGEVAIIRLPEPLREAPSACPGPCRRAGGWNPGRRACASRPADSGGGKYVLADGSGRGRGEVSSFSFA